MARRQVEDNSPDGCEAPGLAKLIMAAGAALQLVNRDSNAMVLLDTAAGSIVTLPPIEEEGMVFDVAVSVSVTSNSHTVKTYDPATEFIAGGIQQMIDITAVSEGQFANGTTHNAIAMNGTTTGGLIGTKLRFVAISPTVWYCSGLVASSGTLATPFTT